MVQTQKLMEKSKAGIRPARVISKVGIIGAGQMGSGIAHVVALSGYNVAINDLKKEAFDKGLEAVSASSRPSAVMNIGEPPFFTVGQRGTSSLVW